MYIVQGWRQESCELRSVETGGTRFALFYVRCSAIPLCNVIFFFPGKFALTDLTPAVWRAVGASSCVFGGCCVFLNDWFN